MQGLTLMAFLTMIITGGCLFVFNPFIAALARDAWITYNILSFVFNLDVVQRYRPSKKDHEQTKKYITGLSIADQIDEIPDYVERACWKYTFHENGHTVRRYCMRNEKKTRFKVTDGSITEVQYVIE